MPAAAGASTHTAFREANFCGVAKSFALSLRKAPTTQSLAASQSQLKANLVKIAAAKGSLIAAAPAQLKGDLGNVIGLYVQLRSDLAKTNGSLASLAKSPTKLKQYLTNTCHY